MCKHTFIIATLQIFFSKAPRPHSLSSHSTSGKYFPAVCHPSTLIMQVALSAKTTTCNTLPIPFQTQVLLISKLLFPWIKHSAKPKARTYLWRLSTWCSELPWPVSTAVAVLILFSQWKSADHTHKRLYWQKLLCAANIGGLVSTPRVAASAEPRERELACPVSDYITKTRLYLGFTRCDTGHTSFRYSC